MSTAAAALRRMRLVGSWVRPSLTGMDLEEPGIGSWRFASAVAALAIAGWIIAVGSGRYTQIIIALGCSYLVAALGYNLVAGYAGQLAFGQAAFLAISAYVYTVLVHVGTAVVIAFVAAVLASMLAAAVVGLAVLRTRHFYLALVTLAFSETVVLFLQRWPATNGDDGISVNLNGSDAVYVTIVVAALALIFVDRLVRSPLGRAFRMVNSDENAAAAMGVAIARTRIIAFVLSGLFGGIGGILLAGTLGFITPENFSIGLTVLLLTMIVIGGMGSIWGTIVGTAVIVVIADVYSVAVGFQDIFYGIVLFVALVLMPGGLVSLPDRVRAALRRLFSLASEHRGP